MGLKLCYLVMEVQAGAQSRTPLREAIPALFECFHADFFTPSMLRLTLDNAPARSFSTGAPMTWSGAPPLWPGETLDKRKPLTRYEPSQGLALLAEVKTLLNEHAPSTLYLYSEGALYHRARGDDLPHWYGRWFTTPPSVLTELVEIRVEWNQERRNLEVSFPHSGYPLTSATLLKSARLGPGDPALAAANRAVILPALKAAPACFGLLPEEVCWIHGGDYAGLYPADAAAIRQQWYASAAVPSAVEKPQPVASVASMRQASEDDLRFYVESLTKGTLEEKVFALQDIARYPTSNAQVQAAVASLLTDSTPCLLQIPYRFGELRLLAGVALAAERWAVGDERPVPMRCVAPLTPDELEAKREAVGLATPPYRGDPLEAQLQVFALLRAHGALGEVELALRHPVHIGWLGEPDAH